VSAVLDTPVANVERTVGQRRAAGLGLIVAIFVALAVYVADTAPNVTTGAMVLALLVLAFHRVLLSWQTMLLGIVLVIVLIPIRRYTIGGGLPIQLEPYRILIIGVVIAWVTSLVVQPATRFRRTGFEAPVLAILGVMLLSLVANLPRVTAPGITSEVIKTSTFFLSFFIVMWFVSSVVVRRELLYRLVKVLVGAGTFAALATIYESRTGYNVFNHIPMLHMDEAPDALVRGAGLRAYGSGQHPIATGAAFVMLLPLAIFLYKLTRGRWWAAAAVALLLGALVTQSRTAVVMAIVELIVFAFVRPRETRRILPLLLPLLVVVHIVSPGIIGSLKNSFAPSGGLVAQEQGGAGTEGSGRLADLGPGLHEWQRKPLFGQGFGTRITGADNPKANAPILDDQWLGVLLEVGLAGFCAFIWLFVRSIRKLNRFARRDRTPHGWLLAGIGASLTGYAIGMATFDAFGFIQVTFLVFILLGLGAAALRPDRLGAA
jgi:polysaccharide biosynthesis protein PslJ